eukprot:539669-Alexandrium_andersonii.AAC.1
MLRGGWRWLRQLCLTDCRLRHGSARARRSESWLKQGSPLRRRGVEEGEGRHAANMPTERWH